MVPFLALCLSLFIGHILRTKLNFLQKLYIPSCIIGGIFALIVLSLIPDKQAETISLGWPKLPSMLINIVFACLFIGIKIPTPKQVWQNSSMQLAYGQIVAWGQYVVGIGLWLALIQFIWPELPAMFGGVLPVGFEGGHGTAGGLTEVFDKFNWQDGKDYALASATFGIVTAIIFGMGLVNWANRKGYAVKQKSPEDITEDESIGIIPLGKRPEAGKLSVNSDAIDGLTLHICIVAMACLIGFGISKGLVAIENTSPAMQKVGILSAFPMFPLCMIGGLFVQIIEERFDKHKLIDIGLVRRIQNTALEFLVVAAIATIKISIVAKGIVPLLILVAGGVIWNIWCVTFLARRVFKDCWFERAIAEMGQSMGVTATGLLLLRVVDPNYETNAANAFAYKQMAHEPFMGGGLWTGAAIPLLALHGGMPVFAISCSAIVIWSIAIIIMKPRSS